MILGILQARVSSTRLPGKVLMPILGQPMLARQLERLARCRLIDKLVVATSTESCDDALAEVCTAIGVECFRGSLDDVLERFYQAALMYRPEHVLRLTGDCPLTDPELIDQLIEFHLREACDYASNCHVPSLPDGLDAEIMRMSALESAWREARLPSEREHVTPFIRSHPERFRVLAWKNEIDYSNLRWTVDEPADFAFVTRVYEALYSASSSFGMADVLKLISDVPELSAINSNHQRNEGFEKSLKADAEVRST